MAFNEIILFTVHPCQNLDEKVNTTLIQYVSAKYNKLPPEVV